MSERSFLKINQKTQDHPQLSTVTRSANTIYSTEFPMWLRTVITQETIKYAMPMDIK